MKYSASPFRGLKIDQHNDFSGINPRINDVNTPPFLEAYLIVGRRKTMPDPNFIYQNSRFFENLLEHRFLFDLRRQLVLDSTPRLVNVLKSEVDAYGFDLVLSLADRSLHVQMKTRSGSPPPNAYELSEALWALPNACAIWMLYDPSKLEPTSYYLLGLPMPPMGGFRQSERVGFRKVKMQQANHPRLSLESLSALLFPRDFDR